MVLSHKNIQSQVSSLVSAWNWTEKDIILHTLPLYHIHGIVNVLLCPLHVGARCVMLPKFDASNVWSELLAVNVQNADRVNVFMAVPTIYTKLIQEYEQRFNKNDKMKEYIHTMCKTKIRSALLLLQYISFPCIRDIVEFERFDYKFRNFID